MNSIINLWNKISDSIAKFFQSEHWKKAQKIAKTIGDLLPYAQIAVSIVAQAKKDSNVLQKLNQILINLNVSPEEMSIDTTKQYSKAEWEGILMNVARYSVQGQLNKALSDAGGIGLVLGGQKIKDVSDIPNDWINSAVNVAYSLLKQTLQEKN